ncbi:MAG: hypothetical protein IH957_04370 [Chloroflexi bacterium]|nr:hypothetical protein [Chloroflexota bacterium]
MNLVNYESLADRYQEVIKSRPALDSLVEQEWGNKDVRRILTEGLANSARLCGTLRDSEAAATWGRIFFQSGFLLGLDAGASIAHDAELLPQDELTPVALKTYAYISRDGALARDLAKVGPKAAKRIGKMAGDWPSLGRAMSRYLVDDGLEEMTHNAISQGIAEPLTDTAIAADIVLKGASDRTMGNLIAKSTFVSMFQCGFVAGADYSLGRRREDKDPTLPKSSRRSGWKRFF